MNKPILLLDVDGVLNVLDTDRKLREVRIPIPRRNYSLPFWPNENVKPFLHWAWDSFDVRWLTCWRERANGIAKWAKLPKRPVLVETIRSTHDWKAGAAEVAFRATTKRRIFWLEDGFSSEVRAWADKKPNVTLLEVNSTVGITPRIIKNLARLAFPQTDG